MDRLNLLFDIHAYKRVEFGYLETLCPILNIVSVFGQMSDD